MNRANNLYNYIMSDKKKRIKIWASDVLGDDTDLMNRLAQIKSSLDQGKIVNIVFVSDVSVKNDMAGIKIVFDGPGHQSDSLSE